jgi:Flp pilus assembly protein TadD
MFHGDKQSRYRLLAVALALCLVVALALVSWWLLAPAPPPGAPVSASAPPDPRLSYQGPYENIDPRVAEVGLDRCGTCHSDIARAYARHPMARSLMPIAELAEAQVYTGHHNPFRALERLFVVERQGKRVYHRSSMPGPDGKSVFELNQEVHYALGSGTRAHAYLTYQNGFLFQSAISWQSRRKIPGSDIEGMWDLSPGDFSAMLNGRPIGPECLFCHANRALHRPGSLNAFDKPVFVGHAIGCERCHGPGEKHVANPGQLQPAPWDAQTRLDPTIVHPGKLPAELREAVCQQCHLEGAVRVLRRGRDLYDFRPGLPLEDFFSIFVQESDENRRAVNHVEQMYQSVCFQRSSGKNKLGCTSCHDPHRAVSTGERASFFQKRCLQCHRDTGGQAGATSGTASAGAALAGCSLPLAKRGGKSCVDCHMPPYATSDFGHTAATDHRILRKPAADEKANTAATRGKSRFPLVRFQRGPVPGDDPELARDLAIAMVTAFFKGHVQIHALTPALPFLEKAVKNDPADIEAWYKRGTIFRLFNRKTDALACFDKILALAPDDEQSLAMAGMLNQEFDRPEAAMKIWRHAQALNPYRSFYRVNMIRILVAKGNWREAVREARELVRLDPLDLDARKLFIECLARAGHAALAQAEFERIEAVRPADLGDWRQWFARVRKSTGN